MVAGARRTLLKHRIGQFWTKKEAFQRRAPYPQASMGNPLPRTAGAHCVVNPTLEGMFCYDAPTLK